MTQFVITVSAATFGFLAVIAIREWASALLGAGLFARVSPWLQTIAIVLIGSAILLLPLVSIARRAARLYRMASVVAVDRVRGRV